MKHKKLPILLALTMSLQLMIAPVAVHAKNERKGVDAGQVFGTATQVLQQGMQVMGMGGNGQGQMDPAFIQQMNMIKQSSIPTLDKKFNVNEFAKIPGFMEFLNLPENRANPDYHPIQERFNCYTLPAAFHTTHAEVCELGISSSVPKKQEDQAAEAKAYANQYLQLSDAYKKYALPPFGEGAPNPQNPTGKTYNKYGYECMSNAARALQSFFDHRVAELEKMKLDMSTRFKNLKDLTEGDVTKMWQMSAVLGGEDHPGVDELKKKGANTDLFDYQKMLSKDAGACFKMKNGEDINTSGKGGGLLALEEEFNKSYNASPSDGSYSAKDYTKNYNNVVKDIKSMAKEMAHQSKQDFGKIAKDGSYTSFLDKLKSDVGSKTGVHSSLDASSDIFKKLQNQFNKNRDDLSARVKSIRKGHSGLDEDIFDEVVKLDNDKTFEVEINALENQIKTGCIVNSPIDEAIESLYDPSLTDNANKASTQSIKKKIRAIIKEAKTSPQTKLEELQALGLDRFQINLSTGYDSSYIKDGKVSTKKVGASDRVTPVNFLNDIVNHCEAKFTHTKVNSQHTGKSLIKELRALKKEYTKLSNDNANFIEKEIVNQMIECSASVASINNTEGSCRPDMFRMKSPNSGFCANSAMACAGNMKSCTENTQKIVKDIKDQRTALKNNYTREMRRTKEAVLAIVKGQVQKAYEEGRKLASHFKSGAFDVPADISWETSGKTLGGFSPADKMDLEDPKAIEELFTRNIDALSRKMREQQEKIMGDKNTPTTHFVDNRMAEYRKLEGEAKSIMGKCNGVYTAWAKGLDQMNQQNEAEFGKSQSEFGEKKAAFCGKYSDIMSGHALAGCKDSLGDVTNSMIIAATKIAKPDVASEAETMRLEMQRVCNMPGNQVDQRGKGEIDAAEICSLADMGDPVALEIFKARAKGDFQTPKQICDAWEAKDLSFCPLSDDYTRVDTDDDGKKDTKVNLTKTSKDCTNFEKRLVKDYKVRTRKNYRAGGAGTGETNYNAELDPYAYGTHGVNFCTASSNQQNNTKDDRGRDGKKIAGKKVDKY